MTELLSALIERLPLIVLSPHLDDGVLSAFALLASSRHVELVTVFTAASRDGVASEWDVALGFGSSDDAMDTRLAEDRAASALLDVPIRHLGLREVAYRSGDDERRVREALRSTLVEMLDRHPGGVVIAVPAAMGRDPSWWRRFRRVLTDRWPIPGLRMRPGDGAHPDHRLVHDIALDVVLPRGGTVVVYEDLPYANAGGGAHLRALAARDDLDVTRETVGIDLRAKERAVKQYASQCPGLLPRWSDDFAAGFDPVEHYWLVRERRTPTSARAAAAPPSAS